MIPKPKGIVILIAAVLIIVIFGGLFQPAAVVKSDVSVDLYINNDDTDYSDLLGVSRGILDIHSEAEGDIGIDYIEVSFTHIHSGQNYDEGVQISDGIVYITGKRYDGGVLKQTVPLEYAIIPTTNLDNFDGVSVLSSAVTPPNIVEFFGSISDGNNIEITLSLSGKIKYTQDTVIKYQSFLHELSVANIGYIAPIAPIDPIDPIDPIGGADYTGVFWVEAINNEGSPISGATVKVNGLVHPILTPVNGKVGYTPIEFISAGLSPLQIGGTYTVVVSKSGYATQTLVTTINSNADIVKTATLSTGSTPPPLPPEDDADGDGLPDDWEILYFGDLTHSGSTDYDDDGATNLEEYLAGTNPADPQDSGAYTWVTNGYLAALGGIILAALSFAVIPAPPKVKGFMALAIALGGLIAAHLFNTGVI